MLVKCVYLWYKQPRNEFCIEIFANFDIVKTSAFGILTDPFRQVQGDLFPSITFIQYSMELNYREKK